MHPKDAGGMENCIDRDQNAPEEQSTVMILSFLDGQVRANSVDPDQDCS